jgi:tyrosyl-tRNA synthetase
MMLKHFQLAGHKPLALVGGATGMIGDPSGKSEERNLLDESVLRHNQGSIKSQLKKFLDFNCGDTSAELVNNYDWMKEFSFLGFMRDVGKHITVNYMLAKDSVKKHLETGISFTEFSYQLVQGYDFLWLFENKNCRLQMGGSDQWGNITTGTELIRRKSGGEAYALTCPLITKTDGGKFGKTETGNLWLDPEKTSPYTFFQYWLNCSDEDALKYLKIFTLLDRQSIEALEKEHTNAPHLRIMQKTLARELTVMVHSKEDYELALQASELLFGKGRVDTLKQMPVNFLLSIFEGVPRSPISLSKLKEGIPIVDFLAADGLILPSKNEARRMLKDNGISINNEKVSESFIVNISQLLNDKYILVQKGKKNYHLVIVE